MALAIIGFILIIPLAMACVGIFISGPKYRGPKSDHFDGSKFLNPGDARAKGGMAVLKWMLTRKRGPWDIDVDQHYGKHPLGHYRDGIRITFVNHSTFLIQVDGLNILTDPVWSERVSPFTWLGPKRRRMPGIRFGDLPRIDVVALSHNHYDHLDVNTMRMVVAAHHPRIIAPLGVKAFLEREYISGGEEVDWWDEIDVGNGVKIQCVPAQHFSGRGLLDRDATLWCGYLVKANAGNTYFAADSGYNEAMFSEIKARCRSIRVALLPIGAYKPSWFMGPIHLSPQEAVKAHLVLEAETSIASHYGTFPLADDGYEDPLHDLKKATGEFGLPADAFVALKEGEFQVFEKVQ